MSLPRLAPVSLALSVLLATPLLHAQATDTAADASDDQVTQARKHFSQGLKLYKDGDFDAALVQFERAYAAKPNFKVLYNIAQSNFELRQYVEARDALRRYLKEGEGSIDPERRSSVEGDLSELERRIAHVKLEVDASGATVYVDGKKVGVTPLGARLDVSEGQRTISVESPERGTKQRVVRVAGGEEQTVQITFETDSSARLLAGAGPTPPPAFRPTRGLGAGFWVTGIGALALGAGAGVTGYLALQARDEHEAKLGRFGVDRSDLDDSRDEAKTFALTTDALAAGAIVCAGIATVLLITHDAGGSEVGLGVSPGKLSLRGNF
jgi:PEGA domain/Tetratricopeptide repeat